MGMDSSRRSDVIASISNGLKDIPGNQSAQFAHTGRISELGTAPFSPCNIPLYVAFPSEALPLKMALGDNRLLAHAQSSDPAAVGMRGFQGGRLLITNLAKRKKTHVAY